MEQTIRGTMGKDCVVVFLQGAAGDITQVNNRNPFVNPGAEDWCRLVGGRIGAEAVKVLLTMARGPMGPVDVKREILQIKRRVPSPEHVKKALETVQQPVEKVGAYRVDIRQGDRAVGCEAGQGTGGPGRGRGDSGRAGGVRGQSGRVLCPIRIGNQGQESVPLHFPGGAGQ